MTLPVRPHSGRSDDPARKLRRGLRAVACAAVAVVVTAGSTYAQDVEPPDPPGSQPQFASGTAGDSAGDSDEGSDEFRPAADKVEPMLHQELQDSDTTDFWVRFDEDADLSGAALIDDWDERGTHVASVLRATAEESQAGVRAELDTEDVGYQAFWATNAIYVHDGSMELAESLATHHEVEALYPAMTYDPPELEEGTEATTLSSVEWGVAAIKANAVWNEYDVAGDGVVVANIDTGVQHDHPALVDQYRGNLGDGTFDHNYNWFDAYGYCEGAPCDDDGHGTHTMGTMAGSDGGTNQIGVAPDVTWIAANGCCATNQGLIESGQWMLEPTDLNGENADAGKRPHIINNSWGSRYASVDPFMDDVMTAWAASGIMGVWSNGNLGPTCRSSSSPGSRSMSYSVGAYDAGGAIADFSSRGSGQDGEIKPNIAAPGVDVRSAYPGDGYFVGRGTSMAAPHVAGAVALLWSGAPGLIGDIGGTRQMLDDSAVDTPDDQCGGTGENNNVFGQGKLDALALLEGAPVGGTGMLVVTVTDTAGEAVREATINVRGPVDRERVTGDDGTRSMSLPPGDYDLEVAAFGYGRLGTSVTISSGATVEENLTLEALDMVQTEGRITDGSGQGWPLYAEVVVDGMPGGGVFTDPVDGTFSAALPVDEPLTVTVAPHYDGYQEISEEVTVTAGDPTLEIEIPVDPDRCLDEIGYEHAYDGLVEGFDDGLPAGWTVTDNNGNGHEWRFDDPNDRGNQTGGDGGFAIADPRGGQGPIDSSLITPPIDLSGEPAPVLSFRQFLWPLRDVAQVDLSVDGGDSWETLLEQTGAVGPSAETIPIPQAGGEADVRVRFRLTEGISSTRYWQIDDVFVGTRSCVPSPGSLMVGHVVDRNTGDPVNDATVTSDDEPDTTATSAPTPDDAGLDDGFYWMFAALTQMHSFTAGADRYETHRQMVRLRSNTLTERDFRLPAGQLVLDSEEITADVRPGRTVKQKLTVTNTGTAPARLEFRERGDQNVIPNTAEASGTGPLGRRPVQRFAGTFSPLAVQNLPEAAPESPPEAPGTTAAAGGPWLEIPDFPIRIMDNTVAEHDGKIYSVGGIGDAGFTAQGFVYDPAEDAWSEIAEMPEAREAAAGAFIDGLFYVHGGWESSGDATNTTFVYDPESDSWSTAAAGPVAGAAGGHAVLDGQLYVAGGCNRLYCSLSDVRRYDPEADSWETLEQYPRIAAHQACGAIDGKLYCAGGIRIGGAIWDMTYAYDPETDSWTQKADLPIQLWGSAYTVSSERLVVSGGITGGPRDVGQSGEPTEITNEGFSYDPRTDTWTPLPPANDVRYRGGSTCGLYRVGGSFRQTWNPTFDSEMLPTHGDCEPADVAWMSLDTDAVTIDPGKKAKVTISLDAEEAGTGRHEAGMWIWQDTPYLLYPVDVTLTVE